MWTPRWLGGLRDLSSDIRYAIRALAKNPRFSLTGHPVVVLSDGTWRRDFGADPRIVGKTIDVNNYPLTIVGVADPAFHGTIVSYAVPVRHDRHGARGARHPRSGVVHGQAEHARHRRPHGARRLRRVRRPAISAARLRLGTIGVVVGAARLPGNVLFGVTATDAGSFARALAIVFGGRHRRHRRSRVARGTDQSFERARHQ